jgi:hypothetical protein
MPTETKRAWVTVVGWSPMAAVNTLWQACEQDIVPTHIYLLGSLEQPQVQRSLEEVTRYLRAILPEFGVPNPVIETRPIDEDDLVQFFNILSQVLEDAQRTCSRVVLDITAGRKYMSAFGLAIGWGTDIRLERLYYNHLLDRRYENAPHPLIPRHQQKLHDLVEMLKR